MQLALEAQCGEVAKTNARNGEMESDLTRVQLELGGKCENELEKLNSRLTNWTQLNIKRQRTRKARWDELKAERDAAIHVCNYAYNTTASSSIMFFVFPVPFFFDRN